jgi:hypothetical protein
MSRAWLIVGIVAVGACTGGDGSSPTTSAPARTTEATTVSMTSPSTASGTTDLPVLDDVEAPAWEPSTRTDELALAISEESEPTVQQAVDAFGLLVEGMPGATSSDLPPGEGLGETYTLRLIRSVREGLTPDQATVVDEYLGPGILIGRIRADGSSEPADGSGDAAPTSDMAATTAPSQGVRPLRAPTATPGGHDLFQLLGEVQADWDAHLPGHPKHDIELRTVATPFKGMDADVKTDDPDVCVIRVHTGFLAGNPTADLIRSFFAHELFHCMQFEWAGGYTPPWLDEGSANWAAADLYRTETLEGVDLHEAWFKLPDAPLAIRQYSAWPFFEIARLHGRNGYALIQAMFESPHPTVTAYLAATQLDGELFRKDWSTRTLRSSPLTAPWRLAWPTPDGELGPHDNLFSVGARGIGVYHVVEAGGYTQRQLAVQMAPEVGLVTVTPNGGPLTTSTAVGTQTVGDGSTQSFCFVPDGCACPEGGSSGATPMDGPEMIFSFAASLAGTVAKVRAEPWDPDTECADEPEPKQASSNGDPHLRSFDGLPFDVMTLGEFVNARDPAGDFEVQTRHEPFGFGAGTTAVALGTGEHRITFTLPALMTADEPVVRVDGGVTSGDEFAVGDVEVTIRWPDAEATWPDGSSVELHWFFGWFVQVTVPPERAARLEGLLGSGDGDLGNDLRFPDGTLADTTDAALPESPFALAWAVDADTTLFDYEPGQSVDTFRIPHPNPDPPEVDDDAEARCREALGSLATGYEISSCAFDVSATDEDGFVDQYVTVVDERVRETDLVTIPSLPEPTPDVTAGPAEAGQPGVPTLTLDGDQPTGTVDAVEGTVLIARTTSCDPSVDTRGAGYLDIYVTRVDDDELFAVAAVCDPSGLRGVGADDDEWHDGEGYVWLPGSGEYEVALHQSLGDRDAIGPVEIYIDPMPTVVRFDELGDGDRSELEGIGDTIVYLGAPETEFDIAGLEAACAYEVYWGRDEFPSDEPVHLPRCEHPTSVKLPAGYLIPVVVFNRTGASVTIEVTPALP